MNRRTCSLFAALVLAVAAQPALLAAAKPEKDLSALVNALQAVSPDPLGGKLGVAIASRTTSAGVVSTPAGQTKPAVIAKVDSKS